MEPDCGYATCGAPITINGRTFACLHRATTARGTCWQHDPDHPLPARPASPTPAVHPDAVALAPHQQAALKAIHAAGFRGDAALAILAEAEKLVSEWPIKP